MKKISIIWAFMHCVLSSAQSFTSVHIYISNPYVERVGMIKSQMYNMDYVRSHHATYVFSIEQNYINSLYDSLSSPSLSRVANDSLYLIVPSYTKECTGTVEMNFEPCIVIDFVRGNKFNLSDDACTFSMDKRGYIYRSTLSDCDLYYPDKTYIDCIKRVLTNMIYVPCKITSP